MKIKLSINERINSIAMIDAFKGKLSEMAVLIEDVKIINLTEKEIETVNLQPKKNEEGQIVGYEWKEEKAVIVELELHKETLDYLVKFIGDRDKDGEYTLADYSIIALKEKLETAK